MPNHIRLFERPLVVDEVLPALMVTGALPDYTPEAAYEGRLPILNSVGKCTVEVLESTLPPGAFVRVDNVTKEVVVKWAAYTEEVATSSMVPGGDFEDGGTEGWGLGPGWSIGTGPDYDAKTGTYSARFAGVKTKGSDAVSARIPAKVNDYIRVTAQVQQGASAKGNAGGRVSLIYRNAEGAELLRLWGNLVTSGSNGAWKASIAEGAAPAGTKTVEVVLSAYRNRENHALWMDDVSWNHKYVLGQNDDDLYFLRIRVRDSLNREAYWQGYIEEAANVVYSQLYPLHSSEYVSVSGPSAAAMTVEPAPRPESSEPLDMAAPAVVSFAIRDVVVRASGDEAFDVASPTVVSFAIRNVVVPVSSEEPVTLSLPNITSFSVKAEPVIQSGESLGIPPPSIVEFTIV